jgi:hypothetical protein
LWKKHAKPLGFELYPFTLFYIGFIELQRYCLSSEKDFETILSGYEGKHLKFFRGRNIDSFRSDVSQNHVKLFVKACLKVKIRKKLTYQNEK